MSVEQFIRRFEALRQSVLYLDLKTYLDSFAEQLKVGRINIIPTSGIVGTRSAPYGHNETVTLFLPCTDLSDRSVVVAVLDVLPKALNYSGPKLLNFLSETETVKRGVLCHVP